MSFEDAALVAQIGTAVFQSAFSRWVDGGGQRTFQDCLDVVVESLRGQLDD